MRLKTGPRVIIVLAIVGAIGWWANGYIDARKAAQAQAQPPVEQVAAQPQSTVVVRQADVIQHVPASAPAPAVPDASTPQQRTQADAALNALLNGGRK